MNNADAEKSPRELANHRKGFKHLLLREWKNFEEEKYSSLLERKQLISGLRVEANKMLDEYLQENKDRRAHEKALRIVQAKHVPNVFREEAIDALAILIKESINLIFFLGNGEEAEVEQLKKIYGQAILEYASDWFPQLIQNDAIDKMDEIEVFAIFYLKLRQLLSEDSPLLSTIVKIKIIKDTKVLDFHKCVNFYLNLNKSIRDDIIDRKHLELHDFNLFLNIYDTYLGTLETKASDGTESTAIEQSHKGQIEILEEDKKLLNRELENRNKKIIQLKRRIKAPDVSRDYLMQIIDDTRKKNGKHNYARIGAALGIHRDTAKKWVQESFGLKDF